MKYIEIEKITSKYYPIIALEKIFPFSFRNEIKIISIAITIILFLTMVLSNIINIIDIKFIESGFFLFLAISLKLITIDAFFYSFYFRDLKIVFDDIEKKDPEGTYLLSEILYKTNKTDITKGFLNSDIGREISIRLGINRDKINDFLSNRKNILNYEKIIIEDKPKNIFISFLREIYKKDKEFQDFIFKFAIIENDFIETIKWISDRENSFKHSLRWWGKDILSKNQSIGSDWSYGQIYKLEKYGNRIEEIYDITKSNIPTSYEKQLSELESVLEKNKEGNVIIVSDDSVIKIDLLIALKKKILSGNVLPTLKDRVMIVLDINAIIGSGINKLNFENEFISILNEAVRAGDVILVIADMPSFILSSRSIGSDVISIMDPYLSTSSIQIIGLSDNANFHQIIENNISLMERFETIKLIDESQNAITEILLNRANTLEREFGVFFTYKSIKSVKEVSDRFFIGQIQSDKALDLLEELPLVVKKQNRQIITKRDVEDLISIKTGVPTGEIKEVEKEKIVEIEKLLKEKIIGQDQAIISISNAIKRSRSGIESNQKPIGSFLFLGPTGVGKTETTKALAEIFFEDKNDIVRLDMSEFSGQDAISRLIGSFESNRIGVLTSKLKENPYSVLLLDEFEKANKDVHDLFLQIIDEGIFSDMTGKKVNVRNMVIIATSNAGSEMIWKAVEENRNLSEYKPQIIEKIIDERIFKPELLNRFDDIILFNPLNKENLKKITLLMLEKLSSRLMEKSLKLKISDELLDFLVEKGMDPKFGARPINRAIQDTVEKIIAEKIIRGQISAGQEIEISKEELYSN